MILAILGAFILVVILWMRIVYGSYTIEGWTALFIGVALTLIDPIFLNAILSFIVHLPWVGIP